MKEVEYQDPIGRRFIVRVPKSCPPELYGDGIVVGPPSLESLGLPTDVEVRLNNQLFNRGILTRRDVERRARDVMAAIQAAYRVDFQRIHRLFIEEGG